MHAEKDTEKTALQVLPGRHNPTAAQVGSYIKSHWRQAAGAGLLTLCIATFATISIRKKASEAYITGDVITVKSPIQGTATNDMLSTGELFKAGTLLIKVEASRQDQAREESSQLELIQTEKEIRSTQNELRNLVMANQARVSNDLRSAERELLDLEGQELRYTKQVQRYRQLVAVGAIDPDTLAGAEATANSYTQKATNQRRIVKDLKQEAKDAQDKINAGSQELPKSKRRLEILEIEINRINNQLKSLQAKQKKLKELASSGKRRSEFTYQPSFNGLVLSSRIANGSEVNAGEALLTVVNCNKLRVEAVFSSNKVKGLRIGDLVTVKASDQKSPLRGQVTSLRGVRGIRALENIDAAQFKATNDDRMRVQIAIPKDHKASQECRIGDRVDVEL
jgi:multidrug resistance efflux pump